MNKKLKKIQTFLRLSSLEKMLFFKAFFLSAIVRFITLYFPMKLWYKFLIGEQIDYLPEDDFSIRYDAYLRKTAQMVKLSCKYTPWQSKCLVESILIKKLVSGKYCLPLFLGIKKLEDEYVAHAWLYSNKLRRSQYEVVSVHL